MAEHGQSKNVLLYLALVDIVPIHLEICCEVFYSIFITIIIIINECIIIMN